MISSCSEAECQSVHAKLSASIYCLFYRFCEWCSFVRCLSRKFGHQSQNISSKWESFLFRNRCLSPSFFFFIKPSLNTLALPVKITKFKMISIAFFISWSSCYLFPAVRLVFSTFFCEPHLIVKILLLILNLPHLDSSQSYFQHHSKSWFIILEEQHNQN